MSGTLVARQGCPAYQSIHKQTNPGNVTLEPGRSYPITGKNKAEATYYQITVEGASPAQRWVEVACGDVNGAEVTPSADAHAGAARATHVLALGWEPAFCLEHAAKTECAAETRQSFEATHLSLHGLWPQPRGTAYCGDVGQEFAAADRRHDWASLPEPDLSETTKKRLSAVMPGYQSGLERHEWIVHGTCFGATPDSVFQPRRGACRAGQRFCCAGTVRPKPRQVSFVRRDLSRVRQVVRRWRRRAGERELPGSRFAADDWRTRHFAGRRCCRFGANRRSHSRRRAVAAGMPVRAGGSACKLNSTRAVAPSLRARLRPGSDRRPDGR